jgi:general secretion pathway protein B
MSLILDALRKSEAERRKAQAAEDTLAGPPRVPTSSLARLPAWAWPGALLVTLAVAVAAWLVLARTPTTGLPATSTPATAGLSKSEPAAPGADPQAARATPGLASGAHRSAATADQAAVRAVPAASASPAPPIDAPSASGATAAPTSSPSQPFAAMPTSAPPNAPPLAATASPSHPATDTPATPTREAATLPAPTTATRPTPGQGMLRLSDLGTAERQQLPPLRMSMHMWGPDAATRFAIIDGNRVGEGDRIGETVVEVIDQDGVVLAWNGVRLRVPVR